LKIDNIVADFIDEYIRLFGINVDKMLSQINKIMNGDVKGGNNNGSNNRLQECFNFNGFSHYINPGYS